MEFNNFYSRKIVSAIIICSFVLSNFLPIFTPKAEAFLGIGDVTFTINVKEIVRNVVDGIAMVMAQKMVDDIVKSTVTWANSGFENSPAFVDDPGGFFKTIADQAAGSYISGTQLGFMCSPFQNSIRLSLAARYRADSGQNNYPTQCTITGIQGNIEGFYQDFNNGGWGTWISMTQNDNNNPYGAYLAASAQLDQIVAAKVGLQKTKLDWSQGFKSKGDCLIRNGQQPVGPNKEYIDPYGEYGGDITLSGFDPNYAPGDCITYGPDKTPGTVIKSQLDKVLPAGVDKLISVQHIEQLVSAFTSGLLQRYVFSDRGLAGARGAGDKNSKEDIYLPGDKLPDGYDDNGDGQIDSCYHGLIDSTKPPSNTNCVKSEDANNSPYFIPICENLSNTENILQKYLDYVKRNQFNSDAANTWMNKSLLAGDSVDRLEGTISRYEIPKFDKPLVELGKYTAYMNGIVESLAKDQDLKARGGFTKILPIGGSRTDGQERSTIIQNTSSILNYINKFQKTVSKCSDPDLEALGNVPPPVVDPGIMPPVPDGWTFCAKEGDLCTFTGTAQVEYGTIDTFITQTAENQIACTNAAFGSDPVPNVVKWCIYKSDTSYVSPVQVGPVAPI